MNAFSKLTLAIVMTAASTVAFAQDSHAGHGAHGAAHAGHEAPAAAELTDGEVKKIDKEAGKITLRHGEIRNLDMAAMTMVLRVKEASMLDQVKVGDKVKFAADRVNGAVTIVQMQKAQ
ncbi:copper-binding protein [Massilia sp. G4R7]|uniref:Copper-binding protein n=1 Tax=Massilia phyllostachyos TaxID=2898585 RepID=A0ABS8Q4T3_9BURK|nr:copper-binding protein [Massilia phyllostachyos]MCD2516756.1 copper-binding protein [Massilia phyllostachyos]